MFHVKFIKCKSEETSLIFNHSSIFPRSAVTVNPTSMGVESSGSPFQCSYGTVIPEKQSSSPHHGTRPPIPRFETLRLGKCDTRKWYYHLMNDWSHKSLFLQKPAWQNWNVSLNLAFPITCNHKKTLQDLIYILVVGGFNPFSKIYINLDHLPRQGFHHHLVMSYHHPVMSCSKFTAWIWLETWLSKSLILSIHCSGAWLVGCLEMVRKKNLNDPSQIGCFQK